jgi:hypothetical protein
MKILGISNEVTTCECCGKKNLKKTIILSNEFGEKYYGINCAAIAKFGDKKAATAKSVTVIGQAMEMAKKWLNDGHKPVMVAQNIYKKFGFRCGAKNNQVEFEFSYGFHGKRELVLIGK